MTSLTLTRTHARLRDEALVRDDTWKQTPIGRQAGEWLDALEWEGASENTIAAYTIIAARLALEFPDLEGLHALCDEHIGERGGGLALLRWFLQKHWRDAAPATRRARGSAIRSLFAWAEEAGKCDSNPTEKIKAPRRTRTTRRAHPQDTVIRLVYGQTSERDRICVQLLARLGLRKNELRLLQIRDFNLGVGTVLIHGKGGKDRVLPYGALVSLAKDIDWYLLSRQPRPTEYLLHPRGHPGQTMHPASVHRWFKRCLRVAGLPDMVMHETRHTAGSHIRYVTRDTLAAKELLGHESIATTDIYLHSEPDELARRLAEVEAAWQEALAGSESR